MRVVSLSLELDNHGCLGATKMSPLLEGSISFLLIRLTGVIEG